MRHRMTVDNASTGARYVLVVEDRDGTWNASWSEIPQGRVREDRAGGDADAATADDAFTLARRAIEDADPDVIGVDWQFEDPLLPWLAE